MHTTTAIVRCSSSVAFAWNTSSASGSSSGSPNLVYPLVSTISTLRGSVLAALERSTTGLRARIPLVSAPGHLPSGVSPSEEKRGCCLVRLLEWRLLAGVSAPRRLLLLLGRLLAGVSAPRSLLVLPRRLLAGVSAPPRLLSLPERLLAGVSAPRPASFPLSAWSSLASGGGGATGEASGGGDATGEVLAGGDSVSLVSLANRSGITRAGVAILALACEGVRATLPALVQVYTSLY